jgi:hypothetical protein
MVAETLGFCQEDAGLTKGISGWRRRAVVDAGALRRQDVASAVVEMGSCDSVDEDVPVSALAWLGDADVLCLT